VLSAIGFLTVFGGARTPDRTTFLFFPAVGALIGAALAGVWLVAVELWSPGVAAVLVVAADLAITGMLHADGLADSADGLLPHLDRERRLSVMAAPDVGAFALAVVPVVLLARWAALATDLIEPLSLVAVWAASRTVLAVIPALVPYARDGGLASAMAPGARPWIAAWLVPCAVVLAVAQGVTGVVALAVLLATAAAVVLLARRRLGGFTGDVLGATAMLAETVALLALAARL
jgi:adenosylcobinamide-GDP ribazoletransferase